MPMGPLPTDAYGSSSFVQPYFLWEPIMAAGTITNWKIYQDQFNAGVNERLLENTNAFNGASNNAIRLTAQNSRGAYFEDAFFQFKDGLVAARDPAALTAVDDDFIGEDSVISPKLTRRVGPIAQTLNSLRKTNLTEAQFSMVLGQQVGDAISRDYLSSSISSLVAAIGQHAGLVNGADGTPAAKTHTELVNTMALMGDQADSIVCWVMHSSTYYALVGQAITDNIWDVGGIAVKGANTPTLGRPTIVTDNPALVTTGGTTDPAYSILGLTTAAMSVKESEGRVMTSDTITGNENLFVRFQGEHAFNLTMKGHTWDQGNGGNYPDDAAIATATNWDLVAYDIKGGPGVLSIVA